MEHWKKRFFTIWVGQAVSFLTSAVLQMALIWHLTALTGSGLVLSIASLVGFAPAALLGSFAGALVDRWNRKHVMVVADLYISFVSLALAIYALFAALPVWLVMVVLFLRSLGAAFHTPAISAITPLIVPPDKINKVAGVTQSLQTLGYILGAAVAGALYGAWSISAMVLLDVAGAVVASCAVAFVGIPPAPKAEGAVHGAGLLTEMREGYRALRRSPGLFAMLWTGAAFMVFFSPINALYPLMSLQYFGGTTVHAAIAEVAFSLGMFGGGLILSLTGGFKNRAISLIGATVSLGVAVAISGLLPPTGFVCFAALSVMMGLGAPFYNGPAMALMQERIAPEYLGRVFGVQNSVMSVAMPLGLIISGILSDLIAVQHWFLMSGIGCLAVGIISFRIPAIRHIEREGKTGEA